MSTDTAVDLGVLQSLDFTVPCGHSQHGEEDMVHSGDAEFIAVSHHECPGITGKAPYYYPCCAGWAAFVNLVSEQEREFVCVRCGETGLWSDCVQITGTLT
jgi:hypothetical protein